MENSTATDRVEAYLVSPRLLRRRLLLLLHCHQSREAYQLTGLFSRLFGLELINQTGVRYLSCYQFACRRTLTLRLIRACRRAGHPPPSLLACSLACLPTNKLAERDTVKWSGEKQRTELINGLIHYYCLQLSTNVNEFA